MQVERCPTGILPSLARLPGQGVRAPKCAGERGAYGLGGVSTPAGTRAEEF
jgi:hypothetical protein